MSLLHQIALTLIKGVGDTLAKNMLLKFATAEEIFKASRKQILRIEGVGEKTADAILSTDALLHAEQHLDFIDKHDIKVLFYTDNCYPRRLRNCADAPLLLYYKGTVDLNQARIVSIVGTRNATSYGKQLCKSLAETLKSYNVIVVSGLAHGIDAAVHKECVHQQIPTIGVLGHGLDRIYPHAHRELARQMNSNGGLLTEFLPGTSPERENFPKRNRIIAGMADVVIVVEASRKGGALITAELANSYHKDVFAFPGKTTDEFSEGCNFLIKTNRAGLIQHPKDLVYYMGWTDQDAKAVPIQIQLPISLSPEEQRVMEVLNHQEVGIDELSFATSFPQSKLAIILLTLEMQGMIVCLPGKMFKRS